MNPHTDVWTTGVLTEDRAQATHFEAVEGPRPREYYTLPDYVYFRLKGHALGAFS